MRAAAK